jgi:hypothetical protein
MKVKLSGVGKDSTQFIIIVFRGPLLAVSSLMIKK